MAFSSSLEFGYVVLGLSFSLPTRFQPDKYAYDVWQQPTPIVDLTHQSLLPPGTMSSILFAKDVSFEHSVSSPRPVITSKGEQNNEAKVFQHPIDSHSQSASSCLNQPALRGRCCRSRPRCSEFLSKRKYRYRSYTQTNDTHCWPCMFLRPLFRLAASSKTWEKSSLSKSLTKPQGET